MLVRFTNTDSLGPSGRWATHTRRIVTTTNSNEALNASQYSVFPEPMLKWYAPRTYLGRFSLFRLPIW